VSFRISARSFFAWASKLAPAAGETPRKSTRAAVTTSDDWDQIRMVATSPTHPGWNCPSPWPCARADPGCGGSQAATPRGDGGIPGPLHGTRVRVFFSIWWKSAGCPLICRSVCCSSLKRVASWSVTLSRYRTTVNS